MHKEGRLLGGNCVSNDALGAGIRGPAQRFLPFCFYSGGNAFFNAWNLEKNQPEKETKEPFFLHDGHHDLQSRQTSTCYANNLHGDLSLRQSSLHVESLYNMV